MTSHSLPHTARPSVAIIDPNTLAVLGLKQILQDVMPVMTIHTFASFEELQGSDFEAYYHFFVATNIVLEHRQFFSSRRNKTIVLSMSSDASARIGEFHTLSIGQPEEQLVKSILILEQHAHAKGRNLPPMVQEKILSDREIEVLSLIVKGYINKEIAHRLNIGMTTVITHRKNIMDKLGMRSVSALTIYAVMNGYVDIDKI